MAEGRLKDFGYKILFLALAVLVELGIVEFAISMGVTDTTTLNLGVITISPLFHILPIIVILVLTLSWLYLNEALRLASYRRRGKTEERFRKKMKFRRFKKINEFFSRIKLPESIRKKVLENNPFKGAFITLVFFVSLVLIAYLTVYPNLLYNFTYSLFKTNPSVLDFVIAVRNLASSIGQTLSPLGQVASSIDSSLKSAAPRFRDTFSGFGVLIENLAGLNASSKYVLCQTLAAWVPALAILAYGKYVSRPRIVRVKRKRRR